MATVTGLTAEETNLRLGQSVVLGSLDAEGSLIFTRENGESFDGGDFMDVIQVLVQNAILNQTYPIGSIYFSAVAGNPSTTLGGGTWVAWGTGRVPVGFDSTQTEFNAVEKTGGAKTVTLTADQMPSHNHVQDPHNHAQNSHGHTINHDHGSVTSSSAGTHSHAIHSSGGGAIGDIGSYFRLKRSSPEASPDYTAADAMDDNGSHSHSVNLPSYSGSSGSTTAVNNPTTATNQSAGGGQAHPNLPPYITCYMWKRTG